MDSNPGETKHIKEAVHSIDNIYIKLYINNRVAIIIATFIF